jgi:hypothetical protein
MVENHIIYLQPNFHDMEGMEDMTWHDTNATMWQALCICIIYMRGKCISYVYERQVWIICIQEASVSSLDLEEHVPRKEKKRKGI